MTMKIFMIVLSIVCFISAIGMFYIGNNSSHLSELADVFWIPIPLGVIFLLLGLKKNN